MLASKTNILTDWESLTWISLTTKRSSLLKALDAAIKKYNHTSTKANLQEVKDKYYRWILCKESKYNPDNVGENGKLGWKGTIRNRAETGYPIEVLHSVLFDVDSQKESVNFESILLRESRKDTVKILYGAEVETFKKYWLGKIKKTVKKKVKSKVKDEAEELAQQAKLKLETEKNKLISQGKLAATDLISNTNMPVIEAGMSSNKPFTQGSNTFKIVETIRKYLFEQLKASVQFVREAWVFIKEEIKNLINGVLIAVLPLIGTLKSIYDACEGILKALKKIVELCYNKYKFNKSLPNFSHQYQISQMISTLSNNKFKDDLKGLAAELGQALINSLSGVFATIPGFEQVKGLITSIGGILVKIYKIWQDYRLRKKLQKNINYLNPWVPQLPDFLLKEPCLVAYVISRSTDSTLLAMINSGVDISTWMRTASAHMEQVKSLKKMANEYLESYNIEIEGAEDVLGNDRRFQEEIGDFTFKKHSILTKPVDYVELLREFYRSKPDLEEPKKPAVFSQPEPVKPTPPQQKTIAAFDKVKPSFSKQDIGLTKIDTRLLGQTYLTESGLTSGSFNCGKQVIPSKTWVSLTWVRWGFRHAATKHIDTAIKDYATMIKVAASKPVPVSVSQIDSYMVELSKRSQFLKQKIIFWVDEWFKDKESRNHKQSKRLPYMKHLRSLANREYADLLSVKVQYQQCKNVHASNVSGQKGFEQKMSQYQRDLSQHNEMEARENLAYQKALQAYNDKMSLFETERVKYQKALAAHEKAVKQFEFQKRIYGMEMTMWERKGRILGAL